MLMFRLDTNTDSPKYLVISLFVLLLKCYNLSAPTMLALKAMYSGSMIETVLNFIDVKRLEDSLHLLGLTNFISTGYNSLVSVVMQGNSYNTLKTEIYGLIIPKEIYVDLDWDSRPGGVKHVYIIILYKYANELVPGVFIGTSHSTNMQVVIDTVRIRFVKDRYSFLSCMSDADSDKGYFGSILRIGYCDFENIRPSTLTYRGSSISVLNFNKIFMDIGSRHSFL